MPPSPVPTEPAVLIDCNDHNAENPLWHPDHDALYWSDIPEGRLFRYSLKPKADGSSPGPLAYEQIYSGEPIGGFTIQSDGALLLFGTGGRVEIWDEGVRTTVIDRIPEAVGSRFNDAIADPKGRVFSGIMAQNGVPGTLYRIDLDGSYHAVVKDLKTPNGMAFSADYKYFYLTDSDQRAIFRFDYELETGAISSQQLHISTPEDEGVPDGMTIDSAGHFWSARWNGAGVYQYSSQGDFMAKVDLLVQKVSCVTFGGENYDRMFISSARGDDPPEPGARCFTEAAGDIFHLYSSVRGRPELRSRILL